MRSQNILFILAVVILAGSLIHIGNQLTNRSNNFTPNTINVMGEGKATIAPDSMRIYLAVSELADTTQEAQTLANTKVNQIMDMLEGYDIPSSDIKTESVSINEEYDRTDDWRNLLWYRANQNITITIESDDFASIGGQIVDEVAQVGGVKINNTSFVLKDRDAAMAEAREKAFNNAQMKAEQLADAGSLRLLKALSISDNSIDYNYPMARTEMAMASDGALWMGGWANLNPWEMEVNVQIQVVFETR